MADCHHGKGSIVNSVIPTAAGIIPAAVGVDIGCGMIGMRITLSTSRKVVEPSRRHRLSDFRRRRQEQLGTLGSGNHFVEVCLDEAEQVWLVLHSGSRGVGNRIASHHIKIAQNSWTHTKCR